mgnify:CR=1 FL=1
MERARHLVLLVALASSLAGCGSDPADVEGVWSVNLTNGADQCMVGSSSWMEGASTSGVPLTITQDGASATGTLDGVAGTYADVAFGSRTFTGTVSGSHVDMRLTGRASSVGGCAYTLVADLEADVSGDTMSGRIVWHADTNSSPDCMHLATCENVQAMNGARPPR